MIFRGTARVLGDDVPNDGGLSPAQFVTDQVYDPKVLAQHCMEEIDPGWAKSVRPGDVVVAGKRFAHGNTHVQGFLALRGLGVGCVVESVPRGAFRAAINAGVPILPRCPGVSAHFLDGDKITVDFCTGTVTNETTAETLRFPGMPETVLKIVEAGGLKGYLHELVRTKPAMFGDRLTSG